MKRTIKRIRRCCLLAAIAVASPKRVSAACRSPSSAFLTQQSSSSLPPHISHNKKQRLPSSSFTSSHPLHLSSINPNNQFRKEGPKNESTSRNEFSRTVRVSKWFTSLSGGGGTTTTSNKSKNKSLNLSISATESERKALATRFRLADISSLSAELVVLPAPSSIMDDSIIEVRGTVSTQVQQTCVRTNEVFDVDLEFQFDTMLKAMAASGFHSSSSGGSSSAKLTSGELEALNAAAQLSDRNMRGGGKRKNKQTTVKTVKGGQQSTNSVDMNELQKVLTGYEITNSDIIEDETCFCTDGIVDVGEIVSQVFRSKLDPYPKKPGSEAVRYTFTYEDEAWN